MGPVCEAWLAEQAHEFAERDLREWLGAQATAAPLISDLDRLLKEVAQAQAQADALQHRHSRTPQQAPDQALRTRGPAEHHDSEDAILARRAREHQRMLDQTSEQAKSAAERVGVLVRRAAQRQADLETLFEMAITRSHLLREHGARRRATYLRAYLRVVARAGQEHRPGQPTPADAALPEPAWIGRPNPWLASAGPVDVVVDNNDGSRS